MTTRLSARTSAALGAAGCALLTGPAFAPPPQGGGETIELVGVVRDFLASPGHADFEVTPGNGYGHYCGNVALQLDAQDKPVFTGGGFRVAQEWRDAHHNKISWNLYDPELGDSAGSHGPHDEGAITSAETFAQWFRDVPGLNLSGLHTITLTRDSSGVYSFLTNDFHPIDGALLGNGDDEHNFYFTYEIAADFTYDASAGQMLRFKGDDDAWVFIDGRLVIDHGGIAGSREMYASFDRLGLTHGQDYRLHLFHAERHQPQSHFRLWTNVHLRPAGSSTVSAPAD
jgi:fibro-slime domain-containing protein